MSAAFWPCLWSAVAVAMSLRAVAETVASSRQAEEDRATVPVLPWPLALMLRLAPPCPAVSPLLPRSWRNACVRELARAGLADVVTPERWMLLLAECAVPGPLFLLFLDALVGLPSWLAIPAAVLPPALAHGWLKGRASRRAGQLVRELPSGLDVLVLCLEAGASLTSALRITCEKAGPGPLGDLLGAVLRHVRAGRPRVQALRDVLGPVQIEPLTALMTALIQGELTGMSLGPVLRAQSTQVVTDRFIAAERAAMQAPVKLLVPLLFCVFPCTFIVIAVPIAARLAGMGSP